MSRLRNRRLDFEERKIFDDYLLWDRETKIRHTTALVEESQRKEQKYRDKLYKRKSHFRVRFARVWKVLRRLRMQEYGLEAVADNIQESENEARRHFDAMSEHVQQVKLGKKRDLQQASAQKDDGTLRRHMLHGSAVDWTTKLEEVRRQRNAAMDNLTRVIKKREVIKQVGGGGGSVGGCDPHGWWVHSHVALVNVCTTYATNVRRVFPHRIGRAYRCLWLFD